MNEKNDELLDKFLRGEASEEGKARINQGEFQDELVFRKNLQNALGDESRSMMKRRLVNLDQKIVARQRMNQLFMMIGIATGVVLIGYLIWSNISKKQADETQESIEEISTQIFASNFEPYPNIVAPIVKSDNDVSDREKAFQAYEQGDYATASKLLNQLVVENQDTTALFYEAIILLREGASEAVIPKLQAVMNASSTTFQQPAQWYLALGHLKAYDIDNAKLLLEQIVEDETHLYKRKAEQVLEKL